MPNCTAPNSTVCNGQCTDLNNSPTNCGVCGNSCPSGVCYGGKCQPAMPIPTATATPSCFNMEVLSWHGTVSESSTDSCGGQATLDNDSASDFSLSPNGSGGCNVSGSLDLKVSAGATQCQSWAGLYNCGGTTSADGTMNVTCSCLTNMGVTGNFVVLGGGLSGYQGSQASGKGWSFVYSGTDPDGNGFTDTGSGDFTLQGVQN